MAGKNLDKGDNFMFTKNTVGKGTQKTKAGKDAVQALKKQVSGNTKGGKKK